MTHPEHDPLARTAFTLRRARDARPATRVGRFGRWFVIVTTAAPVLVVAALLVWQAVDLVRKLL